MFGGFVDGLRLGLPATCPAQGVHRSALVCARDRRCVASCDSVDCRVPPHWTWRAAAYHREMSGLFPMWEQRASSVYRPAVGTAGDDDAVVPACRGLSGFDNADRTTCTPLP